MFKAHYFLTVDSCLSVARDFQNNDKLTITIKRTTSEWKLKAGLAYHHHIT